jgi:tetratricopeptide (TPR) repeat protein
LLALAAVAAWSVPTYRRLVAASLDTRGLVANLVAQVDGIAYLVTGPLLCLRVNIDPEVPLTAFGPHWWLAAAALTAVALAAAAGLSARSPARPPAAWRAPLVGFALAWFLLHLAPTNSLLARFDLANDRQLYLALVGPALLVAAALPAWRARRGRRVATGRPATPPAGVLALVPAALLAAVLGAATIVRNRDYGSEVALWEATVRTSPAKARAWNNLGYAYEQAGRRADARRAYERALSLDPDHYKARSNLNLLDDP